jgi:hypothetical protein
MIRSSTFSPTAPTETPPPSVAPPAVKHSPPGPKLPAWRWLRDHARRPPSLNPSRLPLFRQRQVDRSHSIDGAGGYKCKRRRGSKCTVANEWLAARCRGAGERGHPVRHIISGDVPVGGDHSPACPPGSITSYSSGRLDQTHFGLCDRHAADLHRYLQVTSHTLVVPYRPVTVRSPAHC